MIGKVQFRGNRKEASLGRSKQVVYVHRFRYAPTRLSDIRLRNLRWGESFLGQVSVQLTRSIQAIRYLHREGC